MFFLLKSYFCTNLLAPVTASIGYWNANVTVRSDPVGKTTDRFDLDFAILVGTVWLRYLVEVALARLKVLGEK